MSGGQVALTPTGDGTGAIRHGTGHSLPVTSHTASALSVGMSGVVTGAERTKAMRGRPIVIARKVHHYFFLLNQANECEWWMLGGGTDTHVLTASKQQ